MLTEHPPHGKDFSVENQTNTDYAGKHKKIAIVDDSRLDYKLLKLQLERLFGGDVDIAYYESIDALLKDDVESPEAILLDRHIPSDGLSECRIREIRSRHNNCGVILHTGVMTPSLRSTASHEGAFAVIEKGTCKGEALRLLIETAAVVGPTIKLAGRRLQ